MAPLGRQRGENCKPRIGARGNPSYPGKRVSSTPRLFDSITGASGILDHPYSRMMTTMNVGAPCPLRAQRVGILDHVGPAASGCAGRKQYETRRREYPRRKISAHRQPVRDILIDPSATHRTA